MRNFTTFFFPAETRPASLLSAMFLVRLNIPFSQGRSKKHTQKKRTRYVRSGITQNSKPTAQVHTRTAAELSCPARRKCTLKWESLSVSQCGSTKPERCS